MAISRANCCIGRQWWRMKVWPGVHSDPDCTFSNRDFIVLFAWLCNTWLSRLYKISMDPVRQWLLLNWIWSPAALWMFGSILPETSQFLVNLAGLWLSNGWYVYCHQSANADPGTGSQHHLTDWVHGRCLSFEETTVTIPRLAASGSIVHQALSSTLFPRSLLKTPFSAANPPPLVSLSYSSPHRHSQ